MDSSRWQQVRAVFEAVLDREPDARRAYLEAACAGDEALRREVQALVASDEAPEEFLKPLALDFDLEALAEVEPGALHVGTHVGPYRLARVLGVGGMGAVYLAERSDGTFEQQAAVKLMRSGLVTDNLRRRFQAEQQILARLNHPHIARLYDGGVTEQGMPYVVMEYVDGVPITDYCDREKLDVRARVALFETVCRAVQYAHQNLIVHRDLKPSNILVTEEDGAPSVKLLDFGVAKLLDEEADLGTPLTRTGMRLLTPEYASPEQIRGDAVTTASDVYALGVILYHLLAGQRPYEVRGLSPSELEHLVRDTEPARPSTLIPKATQAVREATGHARSTAPERLRGQLAGDLDTICLKALRKEPERRYASAQAFADDLRRYLDGRPVSARPDTASYRLAKFVRRHRIGVAAAFLAVMGLMVGAGIALWQAHVAEQERVRAERRFDEVRQLANVFLFELDEAIANLPGATRARELLLGRALTYLDGLAREVADDPALQLELAAAYRKIGNVQGNPHQPNLGYRQGALHSYRRSLGIATAVLELDSTSTEAKLAAALTQEKLSDVLAVTGDKGEAARHLREAVLHYSQLAEEQPGDIEARLRYAIGLLKEGDLTGNPSFANLGQPEQALSLYQQAGALLDQLYREAPDHVGVDRIHALIYERIGTIHEVNADTSLARIAYRRSFELREAFAERYPARGDGVRDYGVAHEKLANLYRRTGDLDAALASYQSAHAIYERLLRSDPSNANAQRTVAISHLHLGDVLGSPTQENLGDAERARREYEASLALLDRLYATDTTNTHVRDLQRTVEKRLEAM